MKNYLGRFSSKAFLCLLGVLLFLWSVPLAHAEGKEFTDLPASQPDYAYIKFLTENNIVNGFADGSFRPDKSISRAEMVTLLVKAQQLSDEIKPGQAGYSDVMPNYWAYKYIAAASNAGLAKGYADGAFRPEAPVSRAEACAFILRLTSESLPVVAVPGPIKDVPAGYWAERQVAVAIDSGIMKPLKEDGFSPDQAASRSAVCRALATLLNLSPEKSKASLTGTLVPLTGEVYIGDAKNPMVKISAAASCGLGSKISTGSNSGAEIRFSDGSGLKLDENTEIEIIASSGKTNFLSDGKPETLVDYLEVKMSKGRMFGVLASAYQNQEKKTTTVSYKIPFNNDAYLTASLGIPADYLLSAAAAGNIQQQAPWYKEQYAKKVRVKVDMPFGVASVRGTIWMNEISGSQQLTSVADGEVGVSSGGQSALVRAGMSIAQNSLQAPPAAPQAMNEQQKQLWAGVNAWVNERANAIEQAIPVIRGQNLDNTTTGQGVAQNIINSVEQSTKSGTNATMQNPANSGGGGGDSDSSSSSVLNYGQAGTYGPPEGTQTLNRNVNISASGITLRNTIIQGNLLLAEGIGEGNLTLENVTVTGTTTINGGGPNSIRFMNSSIQNLIVNKKNNLIRILAAGNTSVGTISFYSGGKLEEENLTGLGFSKVIAAAGIPASASIDLAGAFDQVNIQAPSINLNVLTGTINEINVGSKSGGTSVALALGVNVQTVNLNAATDIRGLGEIQTAYLNASNINIEQIPTNLTTIAAGIVGIVGGRQLSAGTYTLLQILQKLQALISAGLDSQAEIDAAQQAYTEANNELSGLPDSAEKSALQQTLQDYQTAINEAQAALKSTWVLTKSYDQALTSDFGITLSSSKSYSYYAVYSSGVQIETRKAVNQKIRGLSIVFSPLDDLQLRFYNSADAAAAAATASLTGSCGNGEGLGVIKF